METTRNAPTVASVRDSEPRKVYARSRSRTISRSFPRGRFRLRRYSRHWTFAWDAEPGEYELCCRARDEAGNEQPLEPVWNAGGYANNAVQRVPVTVV